jgi:Ca2+-binding RTX toxin-like protein
MRATTILAGALAALALTPAAAAAGTVSYEGNTLVLKASAGDENSVTLSGEAPGKLSIYDAAAYTFPTDRCDQLDPQYAIHCDTPAAVRVELGDGDDRLVVDHTVPAGLVVVGLGGDGRDELKAIDGQTKATFDGGAGNDRLRSEGGADVLRGGPGNDDLAGGGGADVLEGGDGDDTLAGDVCGPAAADVLDGGAGYDTISDWGDCGPGSDRRPVTVTVNGVADDGRPGEGDDVRDLDVLQLFVPATVIGGDGPETIEIYAPGDGAGSTIDGRGGSDSLRAGASSDTLHGGSGADRVEGGFGHDTLTGGPGRDELYGDSTSAQCGGFGQSCTIPFGNDTIDARDGEVDQVDCGIGNDRAIVDAIDVVAANCETVERAGGSGATGSGAGGGGPAGGGAGAGSTGPTMVVRVPGRLRLTLRDGLVVRMTGFKRGALTVQARLGSRVVAIGRVNVGPGGTATARVRFTRSARRSLARRKSIRLKVKAGPLSRSITVKR